MIYILGEQYLSEMNGVDEAVEMASTDIQDILDYLTIENFGYYGMTDKMIVFMQSGDTDNYTLNVSKNMINSLTSYAAYFVKDNHEEYEDVKRKVSAWCEKINKELEERRRQEEEAKRKETEAIERAMWEKLRIKYGD